MGNCIFCGKPAGLFRKKHPQCEEDHRARKQLIESGRKRIVEEVNRAIKESIPLDGLERTIADIEHSSYVPSAERVPLLVAGWENSIEQFLEDGVLDPDEEKRLYDFISRFSLPHRELDKNGALTKAVKSAVLRDVLNGVVPNRVMAKDPLPINLQKGEQVVWLFPDSKYLEDKIRRHYVGGSQGVSVRVMKGVYYRVGAFKGHPVEQSERVHVDTGLVVVTSKNIYFSGPRKSIRLPYAKVVSFQPYSNGIGVTRDAPTAKPQIFVTGDGWFVYNLITNLARL